MRTAILGLAVLLGLGPQDDDPAKRAQRIERALEWLANPDPDVRQMGRSDLEKIGRDAVPAIEKKVAEKDATELVQLLRHFDKAPGIADQWVAEKELRDIEADEQYRRESAKLPKDVADKYVYLRYEEALAHVRQKHYQRAFDLANALIAFEPRSTQVDKFKLLRRHCENMITQTTLIEAKVLQPKLWYVEGEPVELSARMKNIYRSPKIGRAHV